MKRRHMIWPALRQLHRWQRLIPGLCYGCSRLQISEYLRWLNESLVHPSPPFEMVDWDEVKP